MQSKNHILSIEKMSEQDFCALLSNAQGLVELSEREIKKAPALRGKTIINFFCEPSTRTRTSFEIAAKWLSADAINVTAANSSFKKGESLVDTIRTLDAMHPDVIVVRHQDAGVPELVERYSQRAAVINAGDGMREHPTQALLDFLSLMQHYGQGIDGLRGKTVAFVGDIVHSRVARSNIWAHLLLGNKIKLVAPPTFMPKCFTENFSKEIEIHHDLKQGVEGADIIACLRLQMERQAGFYIPTMQEYTNQFFVSTELLDQYANSDYVVTHPGPINRGVEVESSLIDGERSLVRKQVSNSLAVRMACLIHCCLGHAEQEEQHVTD